MAVILDVNVFVYALDADSPHHRQARASLSGALTGDDPALLLEETLVATARVITHPRVLRSPATPATAMAMMEIIRDAPNATLLVPHPGTWHRFAQTVQDLGLAGTDVPDAWLAAVAVEHDATFVTFDRGFRRFPGLRLELLGSG